MMEQEFTGRARLGVRLIMIGCILFFIYGVAATILHERVAEYQYQSASGLDFHDQPDEIREFASTAVMLVALMGAGLAVTSGALFWLGLTQWQRAAFLAGLIGGAIGLTGLIIIHMDQKAWIMFAIDNICLTFISTGVTIATREVMALVRGKPLEPPAQKA